MNITEAAKQLIEAAQRQRLERLRDIAQQRLLCRAKIQEANEIRERLARLDAEYARVEAQTAADIAREAMQAAQGAVILHPQPPGEVIEAPLTQPKPEPFRAGLPPERLRKVWAEWEDEEGDVVTFKDEHYHWSNWRASMPIKRIHDHAWSGLKLKPLGTSWSRVEAMADEAEKPTILDLTKLPPGTVCETLEDIPRWNGRTIAAGVRFTLRDTSAAEGDEFPMVVTTNGENAYCIPALVPARVVKEGGEDAQG